MTDRAKPSAEAMIAATEMVNMGFADEGREDWLAHIIDDSHRELRERFRDLMDACFIYRPEARQWCFKSHNGIPMGIGKKQEAACKEAKKLLGGK